jgi:hypothetical protein
MLASCMIAGCHTDQPIPSNRQSFVGNYVYKSVDTSVDKATDHELDRLTLQADGKYDLVQGGSTKARSEKVGVWHMVGGDRPNVELDHYGYPIQMKRDEIRLVINDDLGEWYVKSK